MALGFRSLITSTLIPTWCAFFVLLFSAPGGVQLETTTSSSLSGPFSSVGNFVKCMPENLVDGVSRVSGGLRGIPNNMLGGVGRLFNVKLVRLAVVVAPRRRTWLSLVF